MTLGVKEHETTPHKDPRSAFFSAHMYRCFSIMPLSDMQMPKIAGREKIVSVSVVGCFPAVINPEKQKGRFISLVTTPAWLCEAAGDRSTTSSYSTFLEICHY